MYNQHTNETNKIKQNLIQILSLARKYRIFTCVDTIFKYNTEVYMHDSIVCMVSDKRVIEDYKTLLIQ